MRVRFVFACAFLAAGAIGACSLNPQPIPPGEQPDGGSNSDFGSGGAGTDAGTSNPAPGDSGLTQGLDSGTRDEDAGDASDGSTEDDAGDAGADADAS